MRNKQIKILLLSSLFVIISLFFCSCTFNSNLHIVDDNKNYRIIQNENGTYNILILNDDNDVVYKEKNIKQPVYISKNNSLITISKDYGTGLQLVKYYDLTKEMISDEYQYVIANNDTYVAYIEVEDMSNRSVVVQNIFDKNILYYKVQLDFAKIDTPIENAEFIDNNTLKITYINSLDNSIETTVNFS